MAPSPRDHMVHVGPDRGLDVFFLGGFFVVGACAYLLFVATVRLEWLAVILAVSGRDRPVEHFSRFPHTLLRTTALYRLRSSWHS